MSNTKVTHVDVQSITCTIWIQNNIIYIPSRNYLFKIYHSTMQVHRKFDIGLSRQFHLFNASDNPDQAMRCTLNCFPENASHLCFNSARVKSSTRRAFSESSFLLSKNNAFYEMPSSNMSLYIVYVKDLFLLNCSSLFSVGYFC